MSKCRACNGSGEGPNGTCRSCGGYGDSYDHAIEFDEPCMGRECEEEE